MDGAAPSPAITASPLVAEFAAAQPFGLDAFQIDAMNALEAGESVLVSAPTGSGKTLVAEFAVFLARRRRTRCLYTTPLKALSNQKYRDLKQAMPGEVGLITGDVVIDPEAPVIVMTTEILRNLLHTDPERVADVSHVILDEAHYLGNEGRGTVWEETIVFLSKLTAVTALSATIPNAEELASWVSSVHRPMRVVTHRDRPVPLLAHVAAPTIKPLFGGNGRLAVKRFGDEEGWVQPPDAIQVVKELKTKDMLPAIYFVFSRLGCEEQAKALVNAELELTTDRERARIQEMIEQTVRQTPGMLGSHATRRWLAMLPFGAAAHHAGLLPPLKFLIERLFQQALIKVVFATETLSAGINMPARTVVLASLLKRTDDGNRMLTVGEFQQMMGRAGRRGMDVVGHGVVVASHRYSPLEVAHLVKGGVEPLRSRFTLNFNMVANLTHRYEPDQARRIVEASFAQFQNSEALGALYQKQQEIDSRLAQLDVACPIHPDQQRSELLEGLKLVRAARESLRKRLSNLEGSRQYVPRQAALRLLGQAPIGSWVLVHAPGTLSPQLGVLLDVQPVKSGDVHYGVLIEAPAILRLGARHLVTVLPVPPVRDLPTALLAKAARMSFLQQHTVGDTPVAWSSWLAASQLDGPPDPPTGESSEIAQARAKYRDVSQQVERHPCSSCARRKECQLAVRERHDLESDLKRTTKQLDAVHSNHWRGFLRLERFLEAAGYLRGRELLARGFAIAHLRTTNELVTAEALAGGLLEGSSPVELASVVSALVAEPVRGRQHWKPLPFHPALGAIFEALAKEAKRLIRLQEQHEIEQPVTLVTDYVGLTQAWAEGMEWGALIDASGIDEGQLVRHLRQVIDMLQQLREVPGLAETLHARARAAVEALDRDLVKEVF